MNEETPNKPDSYSVKTTSDITERIQELTKKTGLSHKDLFSAMVTRFYTELETGSEIDQSDDMQQIRYHLNRVENIFLGSLQKVHDLKKEYTERSEVKIAEYKEVIEDLQKQRLNSSKELEKSLKVKEEAEKSIKEILERNKELDESNRANRMTIELLNQKTKELEVKLNEATTLQDQVLQLQEENLTIKQDSVNLQAELGNVQQILSHLEQQLTETENDARNKLQASKIEYDKEILSLNASFEKDLYQMKEINKLEVDKIRIESERNVLEKVHDVKEEYDQKLEQLLKKNDHLISKNQELMEKLYSLDLELQRRIPIIQGNAQKTTE